MKMKFDELYEKIMQDTLGMPVGTDKSSKGGEKVNVNQNTKVSSTEDQIKNYPDKKPETKPAPAVSTDAKGKDVVNKPKGTDQQTKGEEKVNQNQNQ
jgi:hypothetical protein